MGKVRNERTSKRVAKIAGKVMGLSDNYRKREKILACREDTWGVEATSLSWGDIVALAASCLTQTADKK